MQPILGLIGFPPENLPLALMRPLSGSGSLALLSDLVTEYGVESIYTRIGATMYNSSETTFYVLAVYFGSVGIRRTRHAVLAGLLADLAGALSAVFFCKLLFG
ncbi:MAG: spore maturation protein, partial [Candidatus Marinimicrobia bacterium]|nr:spore maturation protein [Candidatus Neomarinimicrobiota bacterium]